MPPPQKMGLIQVLVYNIGPTKAFANINLSQFFFRFDGMVAQNMLRTPEKKQEINFKNDPDVHIDIRQIPKTDKKY